MSPRGKVKLAAPEVFKVESTVGGIRFVVEEMPSRPGYVVMRRWVDGEWKRKSIGRMVLRDERGAILPSAKAQAEVKAAEWYFQLTGQAAAKEVAPSAVTVGQTWDLISDPATGKYPHPSPFRDELERSLAYAVATWGADRLWVSITADDWTRLMRQRLTEQVQRGRVGLRSTEITVSRILTAANWLRKKKRIPMDAAVIDPDWRKDELAPFYMGLTKTKSMPEPNRPRHTDDEARRLIAVSWEVDPRFGLLMALGAELRLGQVARAKRSDLDLSANTFTVKGSGDKKGETIELTVGQSLAVQRAFSTYLFEAEGDYLVPQRIPDDYYLFPGGRLYGKKAGEAMATVGQARAAHINENTIRDWYWAAEKLAEIPRIRGRGVYGVRRAAVDHALGKKVSQQGLKSLGGWSSDEMPRRVYADQENRQGRKEAASARASFRGESDA